MLTAVLARPPLFGAKARVVRRQRRQAVRGVVDVVEIPRGVAVVAKDTWAALKGRDALTVEWDESGAETRGSSDTLLAEYKARAALRRRRRRAQRRRRPGPRWPAPPR